TADNLDSLFNELEPRNATYLEKRDKTGDITFYDVGLGACGSRNTNSDLICALSSILFGNSPGGNPNKNKNCGRKVQVSCGSESVTVTVVDRCAGCKTNDVDLSPAAFNKLLDPS
ncbi:30454_t:CDS:1, partial [Racocetra persica]